MTEVCIENNFKVGDNIFDATVGMVECTDGLKCIDQLDQRSFVNVQVSFTFGAGIAFVAPVSFLSMASISALRYISNSSLAMIFDTLKSWLVLNFWSVSKRTNQVTAIDRGCREQNIYDPDMFSGFGSI